MPWAAVANAVGSLADSFFDAQSAKQNIKLQKQFAQQGIQWKVADAKKAGIHPLYALGAQTHSFAPVQTGGGNFSQMGQSVGRAIDAYRTNGERLDGFTKASQSLQLENQKLNNDLLKQQLASNQATINQPGTPPAVPSAGNRYLMPGQGSTASPLVTRQPLQVSTVDPTAKQNEPASHAEVGWARTATGLAPTRSKDFMDRSEDDWAASLGWNIRNRLAPMMSIKNTKPPVSPGRGRMWEWNAFMQEYQSVPIPNKPFILKLERR